MSSEPNLIPEISVIIPTLNEEAHIGKLIRRLLQNEHRVEIIIADGNSTDNTRAIAEASGAQVILVEEPSRPRQLNAGAELAQAEMLYFVHADTLPPLDYAEQILKTAANGKIFGSFRFKFDSDKRVLVFNSWCTRLPIMMVRGGDQSFFISKRFFQKIKGYREDYIIMEDYDIIRRARKWGRFKLIQDDVIVSARKYDSNPYWKVNLSNFIVFTLYYLGVHPTRLLPLYCRMIRHPKA